MTRNLRTQLAAEGERWIRAWARPDVSREDAAVMVTYWHLYEPTDPDLVDEVLSRFAPAEPPSVPGLDFLPAIRDEHEYRKVWQFAPNMWRGACSCGYETLPCASQQQADDEVFTHMAGQSLKPVAVLDTPKPMADYFQKYLTVACPACKAAVGELCKDRDTAQWSHINRRNLSATQPPVPQRPPWSAFGPCPHCGVAAGKQCLFTRSTGSAQVGDLRQIAHNARPLLSEVQP